MQEKGEELTLSENTDFIERIESLIRNCESTETEFKSAKGGFPGSLWETYSAFANTQGGVIVLGVKERAGHFYLDKLSHEQIVKYKKEFWDNVNNRTHSSVNILKESDVQEGEFNGSHLLIFNIPRASRSQLPVYIKGNPDNTFKRNHEGDYKCSHDEIRRMYADADIEHPRDSRILPEFSIENDIDKNSIAQYRQRASANSPAHP